jgi:nucleotide-binding universal stress UspA family protein
MWHDIGLLQQDTASAQPDPLCQVRIRTLPSVPSSREGPSVPRSSVELGKTRLSDHAPFRKILALYDGANGAERAPALELGLDVARCFQAKLLIIGVSPLPDSPDPFELETIIEDTRVRLSRKFYKIRLNAMNEGLWVETLLALGDPAELTVRNAKRFRANLIIVGSFDTSGPSGPGMHSVPDAVSRRAPCPVLVAR